MPTPKPTAEQMQTVRDYHKKCGFDVYEIMAIAEVARLRSRADYDRYIRMLKCQELFARLKIGASEQLSLIRECGGDKLWTLNKHKVARLHEKLTVRLSDEIPQERRKPKKYVVQTLRVDTTEDTNDQKAALDLAMRYEPGTVKVVIENGNLIRMYANGVPLEVRIMDMSY